MGELLPSAGLPRMLIWGGTESVTGMNKYEAKSDYP
jgi:hypothetical protein